MKNTFKAVFGVALALASALTLKAGGLPTSGYDLILGFTQQGNNSPNKTDFMIDIGPAVNVPQYSETGFTNGQSWNLNTYLTGQNFSLTAVNWGAIGDAGGSDGASPQTLWVTTTGTTPPTISGDTQMGLVNNGIGTIEEQDFGGGAPGYQTVKGQTNLIAASASTSWSQETTSESNPNNFFDSYANPNVTGETTATLWQVPEGGTPTALGTFTLNSSGIVTFSATVSVPVIKSVVRSGTTTTVYFTTVSGHTYTLYYTNSTGLLAPISKWPTNTVTSAGTGGTNSLTDTSSTPNRFYKVGVN
jgi:hypothetical protein